MARTNILGRVFNAPPPKKKKAPPKPKKVIVPSWKRVSPEIVTSVVESVTGVDELLMKMPGPLEDHVIQARRLQFYMLSHYCNMKPRAIAERYMVGDETVRNGIDVLLRNTHHFASTHYNEQWRTMRFEIQAAIEMMAKISKKED